MKAIGAILLIIGMFLMWFCGIGTGVSAVLFIGKLIGIEALAFMSGTTVLKFMGSYLIGLFTLAIGGAMAV